MRFNDKISNTIKHASFQEPTTVAPRILAIILPRAGRYVPILYVVGHDFLATPASAS